MISDLGSEMVVRDFFAEMAELADARDLKSLGPKARPGSIPGLGTKYVRTFFEEERRFSRQKDAGWSSLVARWAHNPKVAGSNPAPATNTINDLRRLVATRYPPVGTTAIYWLVARAVPTADSCEA